MLVLSRRRSEQIVIGSEIRITVVKLEGSQVRLGIEAPDDVMILRAELLDDTPNRDRGRGEALSAACRPPVRPKG